MTLLSVESDLLIEMPSCARFPVALVFSRRSLPAKSTKLILPRRVPSDSDTLQIVMVKMAWLRLDCLFISVAPIRRDSLPSRRILNISALRYTRRSERPFTITLSPLLIIERRSFRLLSRSNTFSLYISANLYFSHSTKTKTMHKSRSKFPQQRNSLFLHLTC